MFTNRQLGLTCTFLGKHRFKSWEQNHNHEYSDVLNVIFNMVSSITHALTSMVIRSSNNIFNKPYLWRPQDWRERERLGPLRDLILCQTRIQGLIILSRFVFNEQKCFTIKVYSKLCVLNYRVHHYTNSSQGRIRW